MSPPDCKHHTETINSINSINSTNITRAMKKINLKGMKPSDMVEGVSARFFIRNLPVIVIGIFFAMGYISVRFDCTTAMETVAHLRTRLEITRAETQRERSAYMSATCESSMQQMVATLHLGLHLQERPPYTISLHD